MTLTFERDLHSNKMKERSKYINQAHSEHKHSLTFRVRRYVAIATKPVHRLQIRPNTAQLESTRIAAWCSG